MGNAGGHMAHEPSTLMHSPSLDGSITFWCWCRVRCVRPLKHTPGLETHSRHQDSKYRYQDISSEQCSQRCEQHTHRSAMLSPKPLLVQKHPAIHQARNERISLATDIIFFCGSEFISILCKFRFDSFVERHFARCK